MCELFGGIYPIFELQVVAKRKAVGKVVVVIIVLGLQRVDR